MPNEKSGPVTSLDELKDQSVCDFCNLQDRGSEIKCPNGGVSVPFEPVKDKPGNYLCFGVRVRLNYDNLATQEARVAESGDERVVRIATEETVREYLNLPSIRDVIGLVLVQNDFDLKGLPLEHLLVHTSPNTDGEDFFLDRTIIYAAGATITHKKGSFLSRENALKELGEVVGTYVEDRLRFNIAPPYLAITHASRYKELKEAFLKQGCRVEDLRREEPDDPLEPDASR